MSIFGTILAKLGFGDEQETTADAASATSDSSQSAAPVAAISEIDVVANL